MANSKFKAIVKQDPTVWIDGNKPIDAGHTRVLVNNVSHYADVNSRVLVNWAEEQVTGLYDTWIADTWMRMYTTRVRLSLRPTGQPYRLFTRLAGMLEIGDTGTVEYRVIATPPGLGEMNVNSARHILLSATASSDQIQWIGQSVTQPSTALARSATTDLKTQNEIGGTTITIPATVVDIEIWAKTPAATGTNPTLGGLYVQEFIGDD